MTQSRAAIESTAGAAIRPGRHAGLTPSMRMFCK
jgi:hypothetical protein